MYTKTLYLIILSIFLLTNVTLAELTRVEANVSEQDRLKFRQDMQINPVSAVQPASDLWNAFYLIDTLPSGVTNLTPSFPAHWATAQVGTYKNIPLIAGVKMEDGIVLSSGFAADAIGPNDHNSKSGNGGFPGDADLNNAAGYPTNDAAVLMISFRTDATVEGFAFTFSFGTEEFPFYVGSEFNDPFLVLLDGRNICKDSEGNNITVNSMFFDIDNTEDNGTPVNLQWNGFTYVLNCSAPLSPGDHVLKFAVCDATDFRLDSGVFLSNFRFSLENEIMIPEVNIVEDQEFIIAPTQVSDFLAGTIDNLSNWGPVTINEISNTPEFHLDGWDILTSAPTDIKLNDEFTIKVAAKLDTVFSGQPWIVHDTATMTIKVAGNPPWPEIETATIFDSDGNGIADSIAVELEYAFPDVYTLLSADFSWPKDVINYSENINNSDLVTSSVIGFGYTPDASATIVTDGTSEIKISIDSSDETTSHSSVLNDGIGPLLVDAEVVKRYKPDPDTFTVNITESVNTSNISGKSFLLIKGNHVKEIEISPLGSVNDLGNNKKLKFLIADLGSDAPEEGDSLQILSSGSVRDLVGNAAHPDNTPVPINFSDGSLDDFPNFDKATIYDKNGDGIGDSIVVKLSENIPSGYKYNTADFVWPENQFNYSLNISEDMFVNRITLPLGFSPDGSASIHTDGSSTISLSLDSLGKDIEKETTLTDGIGPLLKDATVVERYSPGEDSFTVNLTEPIKVNDISGKSFILIKNGHTKEIEIEPVNSVTDLLGGSRIQFNIADLGSDAPAEGDSLKILSTGSVEDLLGNSAHKDNIPVPIEFDDGSLDTFPQISIATMFDKNGDGIGDSVVIELSDDLPNAYILKRSEFSWPKDQFNYNESLDNNVIINNNLIPFSFTPDGSSPVKTDGESTIKLTVDSLTENVSRESELKDGIGPILKTASVVKRYTSGVDTIRVTLSESVMSDKIIGYSFIIVNGDNNKEVEIFPLESVISSNNETSLLFVIEDLGNNAPEAGDSLKILSTGPVKDYSENKAHKDNPPVPFELLDGSVPIEEASYFDSDGDGIVDEVKAIFKDTVPSLDDIEFKAEWKNGASTDFVSAVFTSGDNKSISIDFKDSFSDLSKVIDKTSGEMSLTVHWIKRDATYSYDVSDSAAPVIVKAIYYPQTFEQLFTRAAEDSLRVFFSEPVNDINSTKPFYLEDQNGDKYYLNLTDTKVSKDKSSFKITSISKSGSPMAGDSIWINHEENVSDMNNAVQLVEDNKRVELEVVTPPFILTPIVLSKKSGKIPEELLLGGAVEKGAAILLKPNIFVPQTILEEIEYEGAIFDATGTTVASFSTNETVNNLIECGVATDNTPNGIVILWSRKNIEKRNAGSSMYVGYIKITYPENRESESKLVVPVQSDY